MKIYLEADNVPNHLSLALFQSFKMGHFEDTVKNGMVMKVGTEELGVEGQREQV